jgi:hypothetical protein
MDHGRGLPREVVPITGTIVEVGPDENGPSDMTFAHIVIRQEGGGLREFAPVHAFYEVAGLVEAKGTGTFDCRLALVFRDTGTRAADFDALLLYFEERAATVTEARAA